ISRCRLRIILSCVSVPVLSVHRMSIAPKFWMEFRRLTITCLRQAHTDRHRKQLRLQPIALGDAVDEKYGGNHNQNEPKHQPRESVNALVKARQRARSD